MFLLYPKFGGILSYALTAFHRQKLVMVGPLQAKQARLAWLFLAPAIAAVAAVGVYPLIATLALSLTDAYAGDPESNWVGFQNYRELFGEEAFRAAVWNTIIFTAGSVSLELIFGLAIALLIHSEFKARGLARAAVLIPWALPTVVAAQMWAWMLNDAFGVVNDLLVRQLGVLDSPVTWLGQPGIAMASLIAVDVWKTTPFAALLLLAGLQLIPPGLYEAAAVDGAGPVRRFFTITLPLLKPAIAVTLIFRALDALRVFDVVWVLTKGEFQTESMATYAYRQLFDYSRLGYGSAVSVAIFAVIAVFVALFVAIVRPNAESSD